MLPTFEADSAHAAFIDADKEGYSLYLDQCLGIVRRGGLVMADNAFAFDRLFEEDPDDPGVPAIRQFNDYIARRKELHGVIAPIGDGCRVAVRLQGDTSTRVWPSVHDQPPAQAADGAPNFDGRGIGTG